MAKKRIEVDLTVRLLDDDTLKQEAHCADELTFTFPWSEESFGEVRDLAHTLAMLAADGVLDDLARRGFGVKELRSAVRNGRFI